MLPCHRRMSLSPGQKAAMRCDTFPQIQTVVSPHAIMVSLLFASVVAACLESTFYGVFLTLSLVVLYFWIRQHAFNSLRPRWGALIWDLRKSPLVIVNMFFVVIVSAV